MIFGLIANSRKELFWEELPNLVEWFNRNQVPFILSDRIAQNPLYPFRENTYPTAPENDIPTRCDIVLAIGGDGTFLRAVQVVGEVETPILGVNVGGLGFLTEIPLDDFSGEFAKILRNEYRIEKRFLLKGMIDGDPSPLYALNEILIDKASSVRVIQIQVEIDGQFLNSYISDGLLISTPTGSTGYSLSSGGPIMVPSTNVMLINPVCPHSLTNRPIIIPADATIKIVTRTEYTSFNVAADGRDVRHCKTRTKMVIQRAPFSVHLVKPLDSNFFSLLHSKLNWGKDFRDKKRWSHDS